MEKSSKVKYDTTMSKLAWKLLDHYGASNDKNKPTLKGNNDEFYLKAIFLSLDDNNNNFLTNIQLKQAIHLVGLEPYPELLLKYTIDSNNNQQAPGNDDVIDLKTFLAVTIDELKSYNTTYDRDFDQLMQVLSFSDKYNDGSEEFKDYITIKDLRHILHETLTPNRLSTKEFTEFIKINGISLENPFKTNEDYKFIFSKPLKKNMQFGNKISQIDTF